MNENHRKEDRDSRHRQALGLRRLVLLGAAALAAAGCGGGGGGGGGAGQQPSSPPPPSGSATGSLTVHVRTGAGMPVSNARVSFSANNHGFEADTDAAGIARFADVPVQQGGMYVGVNDTASYSAARQIVLTPDTNNPLTITIVKFTEATPVVLGVSGVSRDEGRRLVVDADVAILGPDGSAIATLTAADVYLNSMDDWWATYFIGPDGWGGIGPAPVESSKSVAWHQPSGDPHATALGVMLDQSLAMQQFDPQGVRTLAVDELFGSVTTPDTVTLGSYPDPANTASLRTYGAFTADGSVFHDALTSLPGNEVAGPTALYTAVSDMLELVAGGSPSGPGATDRAIVAVDATIDLNRSPEDAPEGCPDIVADFWAGGCAHLQVSVASHELGIPIHVVANDGSLTNDYVRYKWNFIQADIAARTGGIFVSVASPDQLPVVFQNLRSIIGRTVGYHRLRFEFVVDSKGVFRPDYTLLSRVDVRVGPDNSWVQLPIVIPIH